MNASDPDRDRWTRNFVFFRWAFLLFHAAIATGFAHWWMKTSGGTRGMELTIRVLVAVQIVLAALGVVLALLRRVTARASAESVYEAWIYFGTSLLTCFTISLALH